jgi:hypothetical protein
MIIIGLLLIAVVRFGSGGLVGMAASALHRLTGRHTS